MSGSPMWSRLMTLSQCRMRKAQKECDKAAAEGWCLVTAVAPVAMAAGGRLLLFFERDKQET
jgi:hypothetical protein